VDFPGCLERPSERDLQISTVKESIKKKLVNIKEISIFTIQETRTTFFFGLWLNPRSYRRSNIFHKNREIST
jgi:hypothetical protein